MTFPLPPETSISIAPSLTPTQETFEESTKLITRAEGSNIVSVIVSAQELLFESIKVYIPPFTFNRSSVEAMPFPNSSIH